MSLARDILGWAELRFTGPDPEKLLCLLAEHGITFLEASPPEDFSFTAGIPLIELGRTEAIARKAGFETQIVGKHGLPAAAVRLRRRWPAALTALLFICALLWSQSYIWYIDVNGNEKIPEGVVLQALEECGVSIGARWVGMHQDSVRNGVILRIPGIRWMTVSMRGSRAEVIVREAREKIEPIDEDEYADVIADRAGLVTGVYALRGTAETERVVLPGDVILGGYATGRFGVQGPVRAIGWAEARTWYELTAAAPSELAVKVRSEEKSVRYALIFGRTRINFSKGSSICPAECDKIIKEYTLALPGVFTLPIALEVTTITSCGTRYETAAELPEELSALLREELKHRIGETGRIVSERYTTREADGMTYVSLEAECLERIGRTVPLDEAGLARIRAKIPKTEE